MRTSREKGERSVINVLPFSSCLLFLSFNFLPDSRYPAPPICVPRTSATDAYAFLLTSPSVELLRLKCIQFSFYPASARFREDRAGRLESFSSRPSSSSSDSLSRLQERDYERRFLHQLLSKHSATEGSGKKREKESLAVPFPSVLCKRTYPSIAKCGTLTLPKNCRLKKLDYPLYRPHVA